MPTDNATLESCDWNIQDARAALQCAVGMESWDAVIKYAEQLKAWEAKRLSLSMPIPFAKTG